MTEADIADRVAAKLAGVPYVGLRVKMFSGKTGTITEVGPTGAEVQFDKEAPSYWGRSSGYFHFDYMRPLHD